MGKWLGRMLVLLAAMVVGLWVFGPYEPVDLAAEFDSRKFGEGVQVYFETVEAEFDDLTPGVEKRVVWRPDKYERRTAYSILYMHGFSATSEEIRPVPDRMAEALDANLVYMRLRGHGRGSAAMTEASAGDWMYNMAEGMAAARATGDEVIVLSTSTGGTLASAAAVDPDLSEDVAAMIFVSPNFAINDPLAYLLTWPGARYWGPPAMGGGERCFEPRNQAQQTYWTTCYPWAALMPMAALVKAVAAMDFSQAMVPALFVFSDDDAVVRSDATRDIAGRWGGPIEIQNVNLGPEDDPAAHVIAGDILSPGQTDRVVADILAWLQSQGIE
ncbi:MAG: alpha/beta fold hydrolase [Pseudomonadota bacterium]